MEEYGLPPTHHGDFCGYDILGHGDPDFIDAVLGFDYMALLKGAGGMMSGAGGMMSSGQTATTDAERIRLEYEKQQAEASMRTWKIIGGIALGALAIGGIAVVARR